MTIINNETQTIDIENDPNNPDNMRCPALFVCKLPQNKCNVLPECHCPKCNKHSPLMNVFKTHFGYCKGCKIYWGAGWNLFSNWQEETEDMWKENSDYLDTLNEFVG